MRRHLPRALFAVAALTSFFAFAGTAPAQAACPNAAVRVQQDAQGLADCRAYEKVSPADKGNGDVTTYADTVSSPDGDGLAYRAATAFAGAESSLMSNQYVGRRTSGGWTAEGINGFQTPDPRAVLEPQGFYALTADLSRGVLLSSQDPNDRTGAVSTESKRLYRWDRSGGFLTVSPQPSSPDFEGAFYVGSSADMSRVFFESNKGLTPDAPPFANAAYEWHDGNVELISRLPNGDIALDGARIGKGVGTNEGSPPVGGSASAVSPDGTQVVLNMGSPWQLYLHEGGASKLISGSQVEGEEGVPAPNGAVFMGAVSKGGEKLSTIFFASPDRLSDDAEADPSWGPGGNELYAYDVQSEELSFLSPHRGTGVITSGFVNSYWIAASKDAEYVYFSAEYGLTPDAPEYEAGLYLWHDGTLRYLGPPGAYRPNGARSDYNAAQVSDDGTRFAYLQYVPAGGAQPLAPGGAPDLQLLYLYDAPSNKWVCPSCNPNAPTTKQASLFNLTAGFSGLGSSWFPRRNLARDGSRLYFETSEQLVGRDSNGVTDVYEWHEGAVNLISSGRAPEGSHFLDASADGSDVFIGTREQLAPEDTDKFVDAYDARIDGGFLYESPPAHCSGDACQGPPSSPVGGPPAPSSAQVSGAGNAREARRACTKRGKAGKRAKAKAKGGRAKASAKPRAGCAKQGKGGSKGKRSAR